MYVDFKEETTMRAGFGNGLLWMLSGIMMGLLVGLAMYYFANRGIPNVEAASASQETQTANAPKKSTFAKDQEITSPFGASKNADDPDEQLVASLIDKNHKEEVKKRPSFSYYAVLPDLNVPIQTIHNPVKKKEQMIKTNNKDKKRDKAKVTAGKSNYLLQVASYRKRNQADRSRGRLKRKGMRAYVETRKVKGKTWYRVMAGPVESKKLDHWKASVASLGFKPLIYPIK
ncbi:MAG TPA: SPOR domain-containing protein [Leucothrix mucor]|uniref:SPOR domain-containing protein n=1 Tax=Leucothrix mucor TaxID=45248 RepID=A0A7V2T0P2_LEUMU|nr:SPOR domain-containing protein [Leucothrix mucor]